MSLDDALEAILAFASSREPGHGSVEIMGEAMALLGNPHEKLRAIHVGGTSGKTSTAYLIRSLLEDAGLKTGLTVSPHIVSVNERVQIGGFGLDERKFCSYTAQCLSALEPMRGRLTYFETVIALAFWIFACENVDYAIVEVGIGGTHDATNILRRPDKISVITPIGLDHTERLGRTIAEIAEQKAGIIVPQGIAVVADQSGEVSGEASRSRNQSGEAPGGEPREESPEDWFGRATAGKGIAVAAEESDALRVIRSHADTLGAKVHTVGHANVPTWSSIPPFQWDNFALAESVVRLVSARDGFELPDFMMHPTPDILAAAIIGATPPARYEWIETGAHRVLLDGAHNPQKVSCLVKAMKEQGLGPLPTLATLSTAPDEKVTDTLAALAPAVSVLVIPDFILGRDTKVKKSQPASEVAREAEKMGIETHVVSDVDEALQTLLARPEPNLLVTGSLYLAALVRPLLKEAT